MTSSPIELEPRAGGSGFGPAPSGVHRRARQVGGVVLAAAVGLVTLLVLALAAGPRLLPYRTYTIEGRSMQPTLALGTEIVLLPARADQLRVGDIVTFRRPGATDEVVTHRIVAIENSRGRRSFVTKGDANTLPDAWRVPASGAGWRYVFQIPYAGYLVELLRLPVARFAFLALAALALATSLLVRIWRPASR
jgi:signal peptidase